LQRAALDPTRTLRGPRKAGHPGGSLPAATMNEGLGGLCPVPASSRERLVEVSACRAVALWRAGEVGDVMFELSALRAACVPALRPPGDSEGSLLTELGGREFRFAVPAVPAVRLTRDTQSLANLWKSISSPPPDWPDPGWSAAVWTALTAPASRVPLIAREGCGQEFAALAVVQMAGHAPVLSIVRVAVARGASKYAQPVIHHASAVVSADLDVMAERLECMFTDALPQARAEALRSAGRAMWLGGDRTVAAVDAAWRDRVEAVCAVMGLRVEIVEEPARRIRSVETALSAGAVPGHLLVWQPMCRGGERLISSFQKRSEDGEVIVLSEAAFPDVLVETRLALAQLGLAEPGTRATTEASRRTPEAGEERFYVKVGGSKVGDVLTCVPDCGHRQWGSDARRKAPRALMGVEQLEGVRPKALFRCAKCAKHRWRARF
jgi:hypothetical protein